jgi:putative colanic acid biosysnthesis UDP-glucose lipid carrier transferase
MAFIALAIVLESGRPIIFRQYRTGLGGTPFRIMKFRTMTVEEDGPVVRHASPKDKRTTMVGRFLRKCHWDELPQLINVVLGDMTLVGPRPHAIAHDLFYEKYCDRYSLRFSAKPGLTGLAQVSGYRGEIRQISNMEKRVEADILYVDKWSLALDISIVMRTFPLLLTDEKSY